MSTFQTTTSNHASSRPNDPIARYAVFGLVALALWAGVRQIEKPAQAQTGDPGIIILQATATPALPTPLAPALAIEQPTPAIAPPETLSVPEAPIAVQPDAPQLPAPVWTDAQLSSAPVVAVETESIPEAAPDPALTYGTPEFNHALSEAYQDLPTLQCPCGVDEQPATIAVSQPTARDYAYSKARTR